MRLRITGISILLIATLLSACGSNDGTEALEASNSRGAAAGDNAERLSAPAGLGCGWQFVSDINTTNVAFPDESAQYWVALIPQLPQTRLRIDGRFPAARYFSYNVYDPLLRPVDAVADSELQPNASGGYTDYVEFTGRMPDAPVNTIYAGEMSLGDQTVPNPALTGIIYRVYVPEEGFDFDGGVGLPVLTLETADADI